MKFLKYILTTALTLSLFVFMVSCDFDALLGMYGSDSADASSKATEQSSSDESEETSESKTERHLHSYSDWEVVKEATKTEDGEKMRSCECGDTQTKVIYSGSVGLAYKVDGKECYITGIGECTDLDIVIPRMIDKYKVVGISQGAFEQNQAIKSVYIPGSVKSIGDHSFYGSSIESIYIAKGVEEIDMYAFGYCKNLVDITIEEGLKVIDYSSFDGCSALESIVIPNSVIYIYGNAFFDCDGLRSVVMGDNVKEIGEQAFWNCKNLEEIRLSENLEYIGLQTFGICTSLKSIYIPASVVDIGERAFVGCSSLEKIEISPDNISYMDIDGNMYSKDGSVFIQYALANKNTVLTIPEGVKKILDQACWDAQGLTRVEIPHSVHEIYTLAFADCNNLTSIYIEKGVEFIGAYAFPTNSIITIEYSGTMLDWKNVFKEEEWTYMEAGMLISCSDGDISYRVDE